MVTEIIVVFRFDIACLQYRCVRFCQLGNALPDRVRQRVGLQGPFIEAGRIAVRILRNQGKLTVDERRSQSHRTCGQVGIVERLDDAHDLGGG